MSINESNEQPIVGLPDDERDVLISRIIDGVATSTDWTTFRAIAAHDQSIWSELAQTQHFHELICEQVHCAIGVANQVELPGGMIDDQPLRARLDFVSRWGGWAAAAAILLVWFFGSTNQSVQNTQENFSPVQAGLLGSNILLDQAQPDQAFDQYLTSGQSSGRVIGEMPERIVIETRPMPDGTIEVLYLRQVIERQIIDHAYRESFDEAGNMFPVPVKLSPTIEKSY